MWRSRQPGDGFLMIVDGRLIIVTKHGSLHVAQATSRGYEELAALEIFDDLVWTAPSFANGHIFVRSLDETVRVGVRRGLATIDVTAEGSTPETGSRFARFLAQRGVRFTYVGVDASALALEHARPRLAELEAVELYEHDFVTGSEPLPDALASARFDLVILFGVLHHVPGRALRSRLLTKIAKRVASGGVMAYTTWRFDQFPRFVKKLVPWEDHLGVSLEALDLGELEPGDHIMTWGAPAAYRYCHAASEEESETLHRELPLRWVESFLGDTRGKDRQRRRTRGVGRASPARFSEDGHRRRRVSSTSRSARDTDTLSACDLPRHPRRAGARGLL